MRLKEFPDWAPACAGVTVVIVFAANRSMQNETETENIRLTLKLFKLWPDCREVNTPEPALTNKLSE